MPFNILMDQIFTSYCLSHKLEICQFFKTERINVIKLDKKEKSATEVHGNINLETEKLSSKATLSLPPTDVDLLIRKPQTFPRIRK
jgi:hypothetical protein